MLIAGTYSQKRVSLILQPDDSYLSSVEALESEFMVTELGDKVVFVGVNGNLFALDLLTGKQIWSDPLRWKGIQN